MILILRGHIRDAFYNQDLKNLVTDMYHMDPTLKIYIHTWNVYSNGVSWRNVDINPQRVNAQTIESYFNELAPLIQHIIIDDDASISLIGNLTGVVANSGMPLRGWKNYWYGKYKIVDYLHQQQCSDTIINSRFDILDNSNSFSHKDILYFMDQYKHTSFSRNVFMPTTNGLGVDNLYMGNVHTMYTLANHFVHHLDDIVTTYSYVKNQEHLVVLVNNQLFASNFIYLLGVLCILGLLYLGYTHPTVVPVGILLTQMELFNGKSSISQWIGSVSDTD